MQHYITQTCNVVSVTQVETICCSYYFTVSLFYNSMERHACVFLHVPFSCFTASFSRVLHVPLSCFTASFSRVLHASLSYFTRISLVFYSIVLSCFTASFSRVLHASLSCFTRISRFHFLFK